MAKEPARVEIREKGSKMPKPTVIVGIPEVGLVGTIASSYLVEQLKMEDRGYIDSDLMPQVMVVHGSVPLNPIRIFGKDGMVVVLSEIPLTQRLSAELAKELAGWSRARDAKLVVGLSGIPSRKREESQGEDKPAVLGISNDPQMLKALGPLGVLPFEEGVISGLYAGLMKHCTTEGQPNVTLLAESLLEFPDPAAAAAVVDALNGMLSMKVDTAPLLKQSEEVRLRTRELMRQTQQTAQDTAGGTPVYR